MSGIIKSLVVPAHPHPYLCPDANQGWANIRAGFEEARRQIEESDADLLIIYSTLWPSIIGHQIMIQFLLIHGLMLFYSMIGLVVVIQL